MKHSPYLIMESENAVLLRCLLIPQKFTIFQFVIWRLLLSHSFPWRILIFCFPQFLLSPLVNTTSPGLMLFCRINFIFISYLSLSVLRYYWDKLYHIASLQEAMYLSFSHDLFIYVTWVIFNWKFFFLRKYKCIWCKNLAITIILLCISGLLIKCCFKTVNLDQWTLFI